jgi:hypothetical protein
MEPLKLIKKQWGRRRFIKRDLTGPLELWEEESLKLRETILTTTNLQIIGPKAIIEMNQGKAAILLEVLGLPMEELEIIDWADSVALIHPCSETVFEADFPELLKLAGNLQQKIPHKVKDLFHIVIEGNKIGLHFFI